MAITGEGTIDGCGLSFFGECDEDSRFPFYKYGLRLHPLDRSWFRPGPLLAFFLSKNIRILGVNIVDSPAWTTHFRCCDGVEVRGVSIRNDRTVANSDGFSIDCSRNVTVSGCTVITGDGRRPPGSPAAVHFSGDVPGGADHFGIRHVADGDEAALVVFAVGASGERLVLILEPVRAHPARAVEAVPHEGEAAFAALFLVERRGEARRGHF